MLELENNNRFYSPLFVLTDPAGKLVQYTNLWSGLKYTGDGLILHLRDFEDEPFHIDIFLELNSNLPIVSPKLLSALESNGCEYGQAIPVLNGFYTGYSVLNLPVLDLIDMEASQASVITMGDVSILRCKSSDNKPVFKKYTGTTALFRIQHQFRSTYCSDDFAEYFTAFDCRAIVLKPVN
ncbi:MAG: hypothetical protein GYA16_13475 [Spirochaetes bacterium]|nr:hypothetical protein [Spirochaetota bacterium]